jgi:hypothetical protein
MNKLFGQLDRATRSAYTQIDKAFQFPNDPDLRVYDQMKAGDFDAIAKQYGQPQVVNYIQAMESRRMKRGSHGTNRSR